MGLFESKAEKEARAAAAQQARDKQKELFEKSEIIKLILDSIQEEDNEWLRSRQNYYDSGERIVYVFPDLFSVDWRESKVVQIQTQAGVTDEWDSELVKSFNFAYTSFGYVPVDKDVLESWASVVQEQLNRNLPNCTFDSIRSFQGRNARNEKCWGYRFVYKLPNINYKRWY